MSKHEPNNPGNYVAKMTPKPAPISLTPRERFIRLCAMHLPISYQNRPRRSDRSNYRAKEWV